VDVSAAFSAFGKLFRYLPPTHFSTMRVAALSTLVLASGAAARTFTVRLPVIAPKFDIRV
jgi:hypothetical protein